MLNQFYSFIAQQLSSFFSKASGSNQTDRYYLHLPSSEFVEQVVKELNQLPESEPFLYCHPSGNQEYKSFALRHGDIRYVIAVTNEDTTIDYLVTLRNQMSEQKGLWKNTSLVLICDTINDSIRGGSISLTSESFPLHTGQIVKNFNELLTNSQLSSSEREVIRHYLKKRELGQRIENTSFLDFKDILGLVEQETLSEDDYRSLQYFQDNNLISMVNERNKEEYESTKWRQLDRKIEQRLDSNNRKHEEVERLLLLGNAYEKLEEQFDKGAKKLTDEDWYKQDFVKIVNWEEEAKQKKTIEFESEKFVIKDQDGNKLDEISYWKRPDSLTKSGQRKWHILIFVQEDTTKLEVSFPFDRNVQKKSLSNSCVKNTTTKGHSLITTIEVHERITTFERVVYRHEDSSSSQYVFNIAVVRGNNQLLAKYSSNFVIDTTPKKNQAIRLILDGEQEINIGTSGVNEFTLEEQEQVIDGNEANKIILSPNVLSEDETKIRMTIIYEGFEIPISVKDEVLKILPIDGMTIYERKRQCQSSFTMCEEAKTIESQHVRFSTYGTDRSYLQYEREWVCNLMRTGKINAGVLEPVSLELPDALEEAYEGFLKIFAYRDTIPTLLYYDETVQSAAQKYVIAFINEIKQISANHIMTLGQRNLFHLGTIQDGTDMYMTPFSPLNVAYQLQLMTEAKDEKIDGNILQKLKAAYSLPYIPNMDGGISKPTDDSTLPEWHLFKQREIVSIGETNSYLAQVIQEKLNQFCDHYEYLFVIDPTTPIRINVINIPDDKEVLHGIIKWLKKQCENGQSLNHLRKIEVSFYGDIEKKTSAFDLLNEVATVQALKEQLGLDLNVKNHDLEDVLQAIQRSIKYIKHTVTDEIEYAHISFFKMGQENRIVKQPMCELPNSLNLGGLFTTVVSTKATDNGYRSGFGIGEAEICKTALTEFIYHMNELAANMLNGGHDAYAKDISLSMHIGLEDEDFLQDIYSQSHWITFVDPLVDLSYFQNASDNLVIVHYSDQLSSTNRYDAITVTDKSQQYFLVIKEFLQSQGVTVEDNRIEEVIQAFNTFNGEWLLRAVQNRGQDKREKMSIVSAIKKMLCFFDRPNFLWVPISMEEIVRVTGNVKLSKKAGLFSGKTIGKRGNCSDDLLMLGLEQIGEEIKLHMYPVEVKIGNNENSRIETGIKQILELNSRINEQLIESKTFDARFLRNYFARLFINNAEKMHSNNIWPERSYVLSSDVVEKLLNDEFIISDSLKFEYGMGVVVSFKKEATKEKKKRDKGVIVYEIPEKEGYETVAISMNELKAECPTNTFIEEVLHTPEMEEPPMGGIVVTDNPYVTVHPEVPVVQVVAEHPEPSVQPYPIATKELHSVELSDVRLKIGEERLESYFWEFGHNQLSNRHLLIGGRSGQGKTYFIQSLLLQLSKQDVSSVVVDYSNSYTEQQLDSAFKERIGDKLTERIVYHEGFPINPFQRRMKEVGKIAELEKPAEVARRVASVFAAVYKSGGNKLGSQQINAIYEATKSGIEKYGDDMRMEYLLEEIEGLEKHSKSVVSSVSSRLVQLVDMDPFDYETENQWDEIFSSGGQVTIIQLAGYDQEEIKKLLAEFILWDLWYYSQKGNKDTPLPVILDEAQNLSFVDGSPSAKILREGRKFGWSAWFATQSFNNFAKDELSILDNSGTKIYFAPAESEIKIIANRIGIQDPEELRNLQKAHCLVVGQFKEGSGQLSLPEHHYVKVPAMK